MTTQTPTPKSVLLGLIGAGIQLSRTPGMHEAEGRAQGLNTVYRLIDLTELKMTPDDLPQILDWVERLGFSGLNITYPCKQVIIPHLHELSDDARALGAVNTVVLRGGRRIGHNTDCSGFAAGFRLKLPGVKLDRAVQIGAGGAGTAVAHAAMDLGVKHLTLFDMDPKRAEAVAEELNARFGAGRASAGTDRAKAMAEADGLIHATPIGTAAHPGIALPPEELRAGQWVAEIVYFPLETQLLKEARARGCLVADGGGMAVGQAADAFRHFTGREPDVERMRETFFKLGPSA